MAKHRDFPLAPTTFDGDNPKKPAKNQGYVNYKNNTMDQYPRAIGGLTGDEIKSYVKETYEPKKREFEKLKAQGKLTNSQARDSINFYKPEKKDMKKVTPKSQGVKVKLPKIKVEGGSNPFWS